MLVATLKGINLYNALTDNFERINKDTGEGEIVQNTLNCGGGRGQPQSFVQRHGEAHAARAGADGDAVRS